MADIAAFLAGFERFQERYFGGGESVFERLRQGQSPRALVISCCDSRADPGMLLGAGPGEIFVVRNVANLVPPYSDSAELPGIRADIEFAVKELNVERIIVLGHSGCGGIGALMDGEGEPGGRFEFIGAWVSIARAARERVLREMAGESRAVQRKACEQEAITLSLENLRSFPWIMERVEAGTLTLRWMVLRHGRGRVAGLFGGDGEICGAGGEGRRWRGQRGVRMRVWVMVGWVAAGVKGSG